MEVIPDTIAAETKLSSLMASFVVITGAVEWQSFLCKRMATGKVGLLFSCHATRFEHSPAVR